MEDRRHSHPPRAAEALPSVLGDPIQLQQVMLNLLMNASDPCGAESVPTRSDTTTGSRAGRLNITLHCARLRPMTMSAPDGQTPGASRGGRDLNLVGTLRRRSRIAAFMSRFQHDLLELDGISEHRRQPSPARGG